MLMTATMGKESRPMKSQLSKDAGPAMVAAREGRTKMPAPRTAPVVKAAPCNQVMLFLR